MIMRSDMPKDDQITLLFVYGTLRRGYAHPMARLLALHADYVGPGQVSGRLYWLGRYPGVVLSNQAGEWVKGDLYELKKSSRVLMRLDRYEGLYNGRMRRVEYERVVAPIRMEDGASINAWLYHCVVPEQRLRRMVSGDFMRHRRRGPRQVAGA